jgi:opacity protein-like surface antigen
MRHVRMIWPVRVMLIAAVIAVCAVAFAFAAERQMNVRHGPETVFDQPVAELMPQLADAQATGENGRIGGELVFWGYRMADGSTSWLFACALVSGVDCEERIPRICPVQTEVQARGEYVGKVIHRSCREVCTVSPGDMRPCCDDRAHQTPLAIGLVTCR